jgi:heptosyltransferase-2
LRESWVRLWGQRMRKISPENIERLLVRGTNWVGDAIMSVPALREIRRVFNHARITLLVRPWVRDVYSGCDFVDDILVFDKESIHRGWSGFNQLVAELKGQRFDAAILLQNAFEAAFLTWRARIPLRLGYARDGRGFLLSHPCRIDPDVKQEHQAYYYLGILSGSGLIESWKSPTPLDIRLPLMPEYGRKAQAILNSLGSGAEELILGLNPGAFYGGAKRWLTDRYAAVADALAAKYKCRVLIFGAANERRIADEIAAAMSHKPFDLAGQTALGELMGLLSECDLLITNDSGTMHLAAALDVPQLAIFGSTSAMATGPLSSAAEVIRHSVDCSPCFLRECPIDFRCMKAVTVKEVLQAAERKLRPSERG